MTPHKNKLKFFMIFILLRGSTEGPRDPYLSSTDAVGVEATETVEPPRGVKRKQNEKRLGQLKRMGLTQQIC